MVHLLLVAKYFSFIQGIQTGCDAHRGLYALGTGASLLGGKAAMERSWPLMSISPLKPNDAYIGRTTPLTSRRCILYIYSTNIRTEYYKHAAHSPFFSLQNAFYFVMLLCLVPVLFAFYIQGVLKFKCKIPVPKC